MSKPSAGGVCLACKFDPDCIYEARSSSVILQCEQFQMGFRKSAAQVRPMHEDPKDSKAYPGLCSNCDNRASCIYPKPEGGIWRCEEYA